MKKLISLFLCLGIFTSYSATSSAIELDGLKNSEIYDGVVSYVNEVYVDLNTTDKDKLINKLYDERLNSIQNTNPKNLDASDNINEVDLALEMVNNEESYIVDLINSNGENTNQSNWKFNLNYLKKNYKSLLKIPNINSNYIDSYISAYTFVLKSENSPNEKSADGISSYAQIVDKYNSGAALEYAKKYYSNYNPNYPNWSNYGDCANFVSQCLRAGGKGMKGKAGSSSAANFSNWFSYGKTQNTSNVSATWRGADAFKWYWMNNSKSYKKFTSVGTSSWNYGYIGDAVSFLNSNNRAVHTMIITAYNNPDFKLAGHSSNTLYSSLKSKASNYSSFIIYNMR